MDLAKYRKFIAAAGFAALYLKEVLGLDLEDGMLDKIVDGLMAALSLWGVIGLRNKTTVGEARESQKKGML